MNNKFYYYSADISKDVIPNSVNSIAIDTETMGLKYKRDRLCVVQISFGDNRAHVVHFKNVDEYLQAKNLINLLIDNNIKKIFHFGRFDIAVLQDAFNIDMKNVYCTKIASKMARTFSSSHGLKEICRELLGINISKDQQSSDWGSEKLTEQQIEYAGSDVMYLHRLMNHLNKMLMREGRHEIAEECFRFLPTRAKMDVMGWGDDVLMHSFCCVKSKTPC